MSARFSRLDLVFIIAVAAILVYQLFVPPISGLSDSGDYLRMMNWVGLHYQGNDQRDCRDLYVNKKFGSDGSFELHYPSSELIMVGAAVAVNHVLSKDGLFDIQVQGLINGLAFFFMMALLAISLKKLRVWPRFLLYALVLFIFMDVGYIAYFNSFYSEPASFIFFGLTLAIALLMISHGENIPRPRIWLIAFFVASALFVTAKVQNAPMGFALAYLGYRLYGVVVSNTGQESKRLKRTAIALSLLLVVLSMAYYGASSKLVKKMRYPNIYKAIFYEILGHSKDPYADAESLGVDSTYVCLAGTDPAFVEAPAEFHDYLLSNFGYGKVIKFYLTHPGRLFALSSRCSVEGFTLRPTYLGNFDREYAISHGKTPIKPVMQLPAEYKTDKFALWSDLKDKVVPKSIWTLIAFVFLNVVAIIIKICRYDKDRRSSMVTELHIVILFMALLQFFTSVVGEGDYDIVKHLFQFNLLCEVAFVFLAAYVYVMIANIKQKSKKCVVCMETSN